MLRNHSTRVPILSVSRFDERTDIRGVRAMVSRLRLLGTPAEIGGTGARQ